MYLTIKSVIDEIQFLFATSSKVKQNELQIGREKEKKNK